MITREQAIGKIPADDEMKVVGTYDVGDAWLIKRQPTETGGDMDKPIFVVRKSGVVQLLRMPQDGDRLDAILDRVTPDTFEAVS